MTRMPRNSRSNRNVIFSNTVLQWGGDKRDASALADTPWTGSTSVHVYIRKAQDLPLKIAHIQFLICG